jgi:tungstate transport system substrate-binding protein
MLKKIMVGSSCVLLLLALAGQSIAAERLRLSTTTSTENSGLLKVLLPLFEKKHNCKVDVVAVGTGKALKLAEAGDVDLTLVHARGLEDAFVSAGYGVNRRDVMYNDFIIIGPAKDPAGVQSAKTATEAFRLIAGAKTLFISRGDESGTHQKEKELWKAVGIKPSGSWYLESGQGMGEVIVMATERRGYTLADRGTYNAYRHGKSDLKIVFQGEKGLFNPYGVIAVNPKRHPHVKYDLAMQLIEFLTSNEGQRIIAGFKVQGDPVFFLYPKGHR